MQKLKELIKLSNFCNFQLFKSNIEGNISHQKLRLCPLCGKKVNEPYIICKISSFLEDNFSETTQCIGLKFSKITETVMSFQYSGFLFF